MTLVPTVPRGEDCGGLVPLANLRDLPGAPAELHSLLRSGAYVEQVHGRRVSDLTSLSDRAIVRSDPSSVVFPAPPTMAVARIFSEHTGLAVAPANLGSFVAREQTRQYAAAALQSHGYEQHSLQNRTAVTITGDAIILRPPPSQPHLPNAQLLPAPQWGPSLGSVAVGRPEETKEVGEGGGGVGGGQDNGGGGGGGGGASSSDIQVECGDDGGNDDDGGGEESAYQDAGVVAAAVSQSDPDGGHESQNSTRPLTQKEKRAASQRKARMNK